MKKIVFVILFIVSFLTATLAQVDAQGQTSLAQADALGQTALAQVDSQGLTTLAQAEAQSQTTIEQTEPDRLADDFISVSLVVAERGDVLYSILGHSCLHLRCDFYNIDYMYSYESEQVRGRVGRFLLNRLKMGMYYISPEEYLEDNRLEQRGVIEYKINLPPEVESELWRALDEKADEGHELKYDYIKRGCTISIVNCLDRAVAAANRLHEQPVYKLNYPKWDEGFNRTLREIVYDNAPKGWQLFYAMTLVGGQVDNPDLRKKDKIIIPADLVRVWKQTTLNGVPLITEEPQELLPLQHKYNGERFTPLYASLIILLLAIASLFWQKPYIDWLVLALQTLFGCLMLWLLVMPIAGSEWSWLIIVFNPLPAVFWKWRDKWALWYVALVVVWTVAMFLAPHRLVEYAHIVFALAMAVVCLKQKVRSLRPLR